MELSSVNAFSLLNSREYGRNNTFDKYLSTRINENIAQNNCFKTIFNCKAQIMAFSAKGDYAVTLSKKEIVQVWDLEHKTCLWTHKTKDCLSFNPGLIKIIDDKVIYSGCKLSGFNTPLTPFMQNVIQIYDLKSGTEINSITSLNLNTKSMYVTSDKIFGLIKNGKAIGEWDLSGNFMRYISSKKLVGKIHILLATQEFLIHVSDTSLMIHGRNSDVYQFLNLKALAQRFQAPFVKLCQISSATISKGYLICMLTSEENSDTVLRFEMTPKMDRMRLEIYNSTENEAETTFPASNMVTQGMNAYFFDHRLFCMNLATATDKSEKAESSNIPDDQMEYRNVEGNIILSLSEEGYLNVWNLETFSLLNSQRLSDCKDCMITSGKILCIADESLVLFDYARGYSGLGVKLTSESTASKAEM